MASVKTLLSLLVSLSTLPAPTLAVDVRQYERSDTCTSGAYWECRNIASGVCCETPLQIEMRGFSCVGCAPNDVHSLFEPPGGACGTLRRAQTGGHPNCIRTSPTEGRLMTGHRWCRNCAAREGRLVDRETGEEIKCERSVEPDVLVFDDRVFNLTAMTLAEKMEIAQFVVNSNPEEVLEVFGQYEIED